ncbi:acetyl-CoA hydrolase/transferase C-terminal domain-containing protein [Nitratireductor luteus]|uniref:acetyl-CoA hydrolase/transferase C-terminal domain-containing protein n=1 Tax=Nitratireductor luteus TaxID=2976980 RepID=UPI00223EA850
MSAQYHKNADALAEAIVREVGSHIVLALPLGLGKANHVANALYARAAADPKLKLTILTALTLEKPRGGSDLQERFIGPVIDRLFGGYPDLAYVQALRDGTLPPNVKVSEFFLMAGRWLGIDHVQQNYIPANYTHAARYVLDRGVNVVAQLVAGKPGPETRYSLSCNSDITLDLLRDRPDIMLVGQVNGELPYMLGEAELGPSAFTHILDSPDFDFPLFAPPKQPVELADYATGLHIARLVPDAGTLQIGIGSIGDAMAKALILRHQENRHFRKLLAQLGPSTALDQVEPFDTGLYGLSEMLVDNFLDLYRAGILKRRIDGALMDAAFFLGPKSFYRELREMPEKERALFRMRGVSYVNELYGDEGEKLRARTGARFVNNAMMVTLSGAVVSDGLEDGGVVSGVGGQYNFVSQAFALPGARSVITLPSTRRSRGKTISNIRWSYGHTTIPHHLRDIVVTEYGIADLRGKTDAEAVAAMLDITDSRFQAELLDKAKTAGKIASDYRIPEARRRNSPEVIEEALGPARQADLLPSFPFGTDFTEIEQRLIPALKKLGDAQHSTYALGQLFAAGMRRPSAEDRACLERMAMSSSRSAKEFFYRTLLKGGLAKTRSRSDLTKS